MSLLDGVTPESIRIVGDIDACIDVTHGDYRDQRENAQEEFLPEVSIAIASQVEDAADSWLATGGCCEDASISHNLRSFGLMFGRTMFLAGRASTRVALSATTEWEPKDYEAMTDEDFAAWKESFVENFDRRTINAEQVEKIREQITALMKEMGLNGEIAVLPVSSIPQEIRDREPRAQDGFGQYL